MQTLKITDLQICVYVYSESRLILCSVIDIIYPKQKDLNIQTLKRLPCSFAKKKKHFWKRILRRPRMSSTHNSRLPYINTSQFGCLKKIMIILEQLAIVIKVPYYQNVACFFFYKMVVLVISFVT